MVDYDYSSTSVSLCFYDNSIRTNGKGVSIQEKVEISQVFSERKARLYAAKTNTCSDMHILIKNFGKPGTVAELSKKPDGKAPKTIFPGDSLTKAPNAISNPYKKVIMSRNDLIQTETGQ